MTMRVCGLWLVVGGGVVAALVLASSPSASAPAAKPSATNISCRGLAATCGASGKDSCCRSLVVPGGTYFRSYDSVGDHDSGNQDSPATVSGFRLDKYEVTVGRFRAFVMAGGGTQERPPQRGDGAHAKLAGSGWDPSWNDKLVATRAEFSSALQCTSNHGFTYPTWSERPAGKEALPINCVTWFEAMAFCAWDGGYLPSEAEWNYAATGGDQQRAYPWSSKAGDAVDGGRASYYDGTNCVGDGKPGCDETDLVRVGSKPAGDGRWGQSDLAGNVYEWNLDWYGPLYAKPCVDCAWAQPQWMRVIRGGSFNDGGNTLRAGHRQGSSPEVRQDAIGIRCARPVQGDATRERTPKLGDVQPVPIEKQEVLAPIELGDPNGVEAGDFEGVVAAPPPPPRPITVTTNNFRSRIVAGTLEVPPDAATVRAMATAHVDHLTAEVIVCFTAEGVEESAVLAKLSGYRAWDTAVRQAAHALRVRPFEGPHGPIEACTPVAYRYDRP